MSPEIIFYRLDDLLAAGIDLSHFETGEPLGDASRFISAKTHIWAVGESLKR